MSVFKDSPYRAPAGDLAAVGVSRFESYAPARGAIEANGGKNYAPIALRLDSINGTVEQGTVVLATVQTIPEGGAPGEIGSADARRETEIVFDL